MDWLDFTSLFSRLENLAVDKWTATYRKATNAYPGCGSNLIKSIGIRMKIVEPYSTVGAFLRTVRTPLKQDRRNKVSLAFAPISGEITIDPTAISYLCIQYGIELSCFSSQI